MGVSFQPVRSFNWLDFLNQLWWIWYRRRGSSRMLEKPRPIDQEWELTPFRFTDPVTGKGREAPIGR